MANIALRSPYFETDYDADATSAQLTLTVGGTLRYTLIKPTISGRATFEISELCRDYLSPTYSYTAQSVAISGGITLYNSSGGIEDDTYTFSHTGYDGYTTFMDGSNDDLGSGLAQSNTIMYVLEGQTPQIPTFSGYVSSYAGVTVVSVCEPKYTPIKISFINRFGFLQDIWFFKKSVKTINTGSESYKSNINNSSGQYSTANRQYSIMSKNGKEIMTANTGFVSEGFNVAIDELMLSELVWATISSVTYPVNLTSSSLTFKSEVNEKLIDYTIEFEFAFDKVNSVR